MGSKCLQSRSCQRASEETQCKASLWALYVISGPSLHRGGSSLVAPGLSLQSPFHSISLSLSCSPAAAPQSHEMERVFQASVALATSDDRFLFFFFFLTSGCLCNLKRLRRNVTSLLVSVSLPLLWHPACCAPIDLLLLLLTT